MRVSETEAIAHLGGIRGEDPTTYDIGYAMAFGQNERKVIAAACLDISAHRYRGNETGKRLEQILLHTTDGLAAGGFLEHLKLPHYVTFQSGLDAAMAARAEQEAELERRLAEATAAEPAAVDESDIPVRDGTATEGVDA